MFWVLAGNAKDFFFWVLEKRLRCAQHSLIASLSRDVCDSPRQTSLLYQLINIASGVCGMVVCAREACEAALLCWLRGRRLPRVQQETLALVAGDGKKVAQPVSKRVRYCVSIYLFFLVFYLEVSVVRLYRSVLLTVSRFGFKNPLFDLSLLLFSFYEEQRRFKLFQIAWYGHTKSYTMPIPVLR